MRVAWRGHRHDIGTMLPQRPGPIGGSVGDAQPVCNAPDCLGGAADDARHLHTRLPQRQGMALACRSGAQNDRAERHDAPFPRWGEG